MDKALSRTPELTACIMRLVQVADRFHLLESKHTQVSLTGCVSWLVVSWTSRGNALLACIAALAMMSFPGRPQSRAEGGACRQMFVARTRRVRFNLMQNSRHHVTPYLLARSCFGMMIQPPPHALILADRAHPLVTRPDLEPVPAAWELPLPLAWLTFVDPLAVLLPVRDPRPPELGADLRACIGISLDQPQALLLVALVGPPGLPA